jgi:hypothetical protein
LTDVIRECCPEALPQRATGVDPGAHYRGPNVFGIPLDPYRLLEAYPNVTREGARHVVKKILRMGKKGIGERQLIAELRCCINRWEQMLDEEDANAKIEEQNGIFKGLGKPVASAPIDPTPLPQNFFLNEQHTTKTTKSAVRKARQAKKPKFDAKAEKEAREALRAADRRAGSRSSKKRKGRNRAGSLD